MFWFDGSTYAAAEVVEVEFPLSFKASAWPGLKFEDALKAHRKHQMDLLQIEDRVKFQVIETGRDLLSFAICRQDSGRGGWCEVKTPDGERTLFAHPRARARELGCEWAAPLGPVREGGSSSPEPTPKAKPRRQKVAA